jgi:hypothetical protein
MVAFTPVIKKFAKHGDKTGWTYIEIPAAVAEQLKPGNKKTFRVKGTLDVHAISGVALLPAGGGSFIMALNATMRKAIRKGTGATVSVKLEVDNRQRALPPGFLDCLRDEPAAFERYQNLSKSHKGYFTIWLTSVKTEAARAKRMAQAVNALAKGQDFVQMMHALKQERQELLR